MSRVLIVVPNDTAVTRTARVLYMHHTLFELYCPTEPTAVTPLENACAGEAEVMYAK